MIRYIEAKTLIFSFLQKGEPIQVKDCNAKHEICPPPPKIYYQGQKISEEADKKETEEEQKEPSKTAIWIHDGIIYFPSIHICYGFF